MSRHSAFTSTQPPINGAGWQAFRQIAPDRIGLGPHATQLYRELIAAAESGQAVTTIILASTLVDVVLCEGASYQFDEDDMLGMGLDWLSAGERRRLDWLRARRNAIVHHEGPVDGLMGQADDTALLASDADRALGVIVPVLEGLEQF